jgi:cell division transport system permease protein
MKNIFNKNGNSSSTSTIISLSLVLFIVGLLAFVLINANKVSDKMKESIVFSIMLYNSTDNTSEEIILNQRAEFNNYLDGSGYFLDVTFIDKEISFANLQEDMGEDFSSVLGSNPLLDSYDAYVKAEFVSPNGLKEIEDFINTFKGSDVVQDVFYQRNLVEKLNSNVKNISLFLLAFCVVFFLISFALINNTIRLSIYSKRLLIRTMRLVGATNMFIQKPYLISSVYQGFFSSVVAIFMLIGSLEIIKKQIPELIQTNDFLEIAIIFGLILIFGIIISWISTFFAVRKYLNLNENKLFN